MPAVLVSALFYKGLLELTKKRQLGIHVIKKTLDLILDNQHTIDKFGTKLLQITVKGGEIARQKKMQIFNCFLPNIYNIYKYFTGQSDLRSHHITGYLELFLPHRSQGYNEFSNFSPMFTLSHCTVTLSMVLFTKGR